jgi:hypothetical protein
MHSAKMHFVAGTSNIGKEMMRYDFHMRFWRALFGHLTHDRLPPITSAAGR